MLTLTRVTALAVLLITVSLHAAGNYGEPAAEFPPGAFNDGQRYQLNDYRGKVVVLYFYEKDCPRARAGVPQRNAVVRQYEGKPVRFIAIAAGDTLPQARSYAGSTRLAMPVFADPYSLMERRYGQSISLQNIYQFRVIGPNGKIVGYRMEPQDIDKALAEVELKYDPSEYHPRLRPAIEQLEWNQYAAGIKLLRPLLKHSDAELAGSANKLLDTIKAEAADILRQAETAAANGEPVEAFDLYGKVSAMFGPTDELGNQAVEAARKLQADEKVKAELEARRMFDRIVNFMSAPSPKPPADVAKLAAEIGTKYPETPTGQRALALQRELGG